jgi:XTP/dITP diphosphohydrolase
MLTIATHNPHKLQEISDILAPLVCQGTQHLQMSPPEETGLTFIENAIIKARAVSKVAQTPCLADDSGLVVPALQGRPGIYSARYAGFNASDEENRQQLLHDMRHLQHDDRNAYFYCVMVLLQHEKDPTPIISIGQWYGCITESPAGTGGFGYDPLFFLPGLQKTAAQLNKTDKNRLSHRGMALTELLPHLHHFTS